MHVTRFARMIPNRTRTKIPFITNVKATYTLALPRNTKHIAMDSQVCFHTQLCANPVRSLWYTTGSVEPVDDINKDVSDASLLPTIVSTYSVD